MNVTREKSEYISGIIEENEKKLWEEESNMTKEWIRCVVVCRPLTEKT